MIYTVVFMLFIAIFLFFIESKMLKSKKLYKEEKFAKILGIAFFGISLFHFTHIFTKVTNNIH